MKYHVPGSINSYLAIPQMRALDVSTLPLPVVTSEIKAYRAVESEVSPDAAAVEFYCMNHLTSVVRAKFHPDEPLPEWAQKIMDAYVACVTEQGQRLASYILLIVAREARHVSNGSLSASWMQAFSEEFRKYLKEVQDYSHMKATNHICDAAPQMTVGEYTKAISTVFYKGSWGGGFGGKPWGRIADCLSKMIHGETTIEQMVDTSYSLAHNNGPMFNKGMLYSHYSGEFIKVLDVQRSGQIPEAVLSGELADYTPASLKGLVELVEKAFPGSFGTHVDWVKVEKLGSVKKYPQEKKKMPGHVEYVAPPTISGKKTKVVGTFVPFPGESVEILQRVA